VHVRPQKRREIKLMKQIDETITTHGGWPDAFIAK